MLTAKDDAIDRILGLEIGADDYLTKPFSPREVLARMKAIFRRVEPRQEVVEHEFLTAGDIKADLSNYQVTVRGERIELTPKEFELLVYFMKRKERVIDRDTLLDRIWQYDFSGQSRIVDVHVSHLREKLKWTLSIPNICKLYAALAINFRCRINETQAFRLSYSFSTYLFAFLWQLETC